MFPNSRHLQNAKNILSKQNQNQKYPIKLCFNIKPASYEIKREKLFIWNAKNGTDFWNLSKYDKWREKCR